MVKVKTAIYRRIFSSLLAVLFLINCVFPSPVLAQALRLPEPGVMVQTSQPFTPALLKGVKVDVDNPFKFEFIVDKGQEALEGDALAEEGRRLIRYFLTALTVPEADAWVNLSPYEKDRIIADALGRTELGRDMLEQDYILKQLTATMIHPESELGKKFWDKVYADAQAKLGTTDVPLDAFNKVWVMPDKATIYETGSGAYVVTNVLKVMTDQDYLAQVNHKSDSVEAEDAQTRVINATTSQMVKEVLIPAITREVNEGKNFANLRQIYNAMLLATWYKVKVKDSILNTTFAGKNKISGAELDDKTVKEQIYHQYLEAFKKGVYSFIKEDLDAYTNEIIPRKYFSGGEIFYQTNAGQIEGVQVVTAGTQEGDAAQAAMAQKGDGTVVVMETNIQPQQADKAQAQEPASAIDIIRSLAAKEPTDELLANIFKLEPLERKLHLAQLIEMLRNSLSWREGHHEQIQDALNQLINEAVAGREELRVKPKVLTAFQEARADLRGLKLSELKVLGGRKLFFGIAIVGKKVYIEQELIDQLESLDHFAERLRAVFDRALSDDQDVGLLTYWESLLKRTKKAAALKMFGMTKEEDPKEVIRIFESIFYVNKTSQNYKDLQAIFLANGLTFPELERGSESEQLVNDTIRFAKWAIDQNLMNHIMGEVQENSKPFFAFAGNPTTSAHLITLLVTTIVLKAKQGDMKLTGDDFRKLVLTLTKIMRLTMNQRIVSTIGSIYNIPEGFTDGNGEEGLDQVMFSEYYRNSRDYITGTDHFRAFAKNLFVTIEKGNAWDFWYYYRKPHARFLMRALLQNAKHYGLTETQVKNLNILINAMDLEGDEYQENIKEMQRTHYMNLREEKLVDAEVLKFQNWLRDIGITELPNLDVVSKVWLHNMNLFPESEWKIGLAIMMRDPIEMDPIRDAMINGTLSDTGDTDGTGNILGRTMRLNFPPMPESMNAVSSTASRNALLQLSLFGYIEQDMHPGFFSISTEGWNYILSDDAYRATQFNNQIMPFSAAVMARKGEKNGEVGGGRKALEELKVLLPERNLSIGKRYDSKGKLDGYDLVVGSGDTAFTVQVKSSVKKIESEVVLVNTLILNSKNDLTEQEIAILKQFNNADLAMAGSQDVVQTDIYGGIDFDINEDNLDIQSEGPEIRFNLDPAMLQQGNFDGLIPVILNIAPVSDIPLFLGAQQKPAPELAAAGV